MQKLSFFPEAILKYVVSRYRIKLRHRLRGEFETAYNKLLHFERFAQFHPYMKKVSCLEECHTNCKDYNVEEEVGLFRSLKFRPRYSVRVLEPLVGKQIRYISRVKYGLDLCIDFKFTNDRNGNIIVEEEIELKTHRFVAFIFFKILKKTHLQVFDSIRTLLEGEARTPLRELSKAC